MILDDRNSQSVGPSDRELFSGHLLLKFVERRLVAKLSPADFVACKWWKPLGLCPLPPGSSPGGPTANVLILLDFVHGTLVAKAPWPACDSSDPAVWGLSPRLDACRGRMP